MPLWSSGVGVLDGCGKTLQTSLTDVLEHLKNKGKELPAGLQIPENLRCIREGKLLNKCLLQDVLLLWQPAA